MTIRTFKTAILGIDIQNDFTKPTGTLFVKGADLDVIRMASFIDKYGSIIDYVALSVDSHQPIHITNQCYWKDQEGYPPALFATISSDDVKTGKWRPQYNKDLALDYLIDLESQEAVCTIWPAHCIIGSQGWAINNFLLNSLTTWCIEGAKSYELYLKGYNQATEHYSIFRAAVEYENSDETKLNTKLLNKLQSYDRIVVMGEAADFCVINSLIDLITYAPQMSDKIVILEDCMSWIQPDNEKAKILYEKAKQQGVRFTDVDGYAKLV